VIRLTAYNPYMPFIWLLLRLIDIYTWVIIIAVVMSWLVAFGVINVHNQFARTVVRVLDALTEPVFRQVRRVIPPIGGLDISPLIVLIFLQFLTYSIYYYLV
jgi:YggT family protein